MTYAIATRRTEDDFLEFDKEVSKLDKAISIARVSCKHCFEVEIRGFNHDKEMVLHLIKQHGKAIINLTQKGERDDK